MKQFLKAMRKHKDICIKFPYTKEEVKQKMEEFKCLSKFPNVVGAIDGSHFKIPAREENPADYFNRKQFYSLVLQAIVDANQKFLHIAAGFPGSMHDSRIFQMYEYLRLA